MREVVALNKASAAVEVEEVCEAMLALWIGTTGTGAGCSGGFLLNGATIA